MSLQGHRAAGATIISCAVLTISDTRTAATDAGGDLLVSLIAAGGHQVASRELVRDEPDAIEAAVRAFCRMESVQAIITTGGTGVSPRDRTVDTLTPLFDQDLAGFGELFRMLSFDDIGAAAMLSRATAGILGSRPVFLLPGSPHAITLAMTKLILPELGHLVRELSK